ncbi:MAG: class I SAM-dependent methyltransferase [Actinobacteria bacterium]|nr:class I SAM-dependent methyltransferase [Actinomycetota bacterium]
MKQPSNDEQARWEQLYKEEQTETMPWYYPNIEHILDLGTGPGTQAIALAKMGFRVTATDISATAISKAKEKSKQEELSIDFFQDDIVDTKINDKFDFIFDRGCFHTLPPEKRDVYVKNVHRILKTGGILFLKCFSYKEKTLGGPHRFSPEQIEEYFHRHFEILSITDTIFQGNRRPLPKALFSIMKKIG